MGHVWIIETFDCYIGGSSLEVFEDEADADKKLADIVTKKGWVLAHPKDNIPGTVKKHGSWIYKYREGVKLHKCPICPIMEL